MAQVAVNPLEDSSSNLLGFSSLPASSPPSECDIASPGVANEGDAPLFELCFTEPPDTTVGGPLSVPPMEDFPIGAMVRMQEEEFCSRALGDQWRCWMSALCSEDMLVNIVRHLTEHTVVDGRVCPSAWGLRPALPPAQDEGNAAAGSTPSSQRWDVNADSEDQRLYFRITVPRACLVRPRVSSVHVPHYTTPPHTDSASTPGHIAGIQQTFSQEATPMGSVPVPATFGGDASPSHSMNVTLPPGSVPSTIKSVRDRGNQLFRDRLFDQAVDLYTHAVKLVESVVESRGGTEHVRCLSCRSATLVHLRRYDEALQDAQRIIAYAPESVHGYVRAGNAMRAQRKYAGAETYYGQAAALRPDDENLRRQREANTLAATLTPSLPSQIDVVVDASRIIVVAKRRFSRGQRLLTEAPLATVATLGDSQDAASDVPSPGCAPGCCAHCHSPRLDVESVLEHLRNAGLSEATLRHAERIMQSCGVYAAPESVPCGHRCGAVYCSEKCRALAWDRYHWAECAEQGPWRRCTIELARVIAAHTTNARVLPPKIFWLTYRLLAVFVREHGQTTPSFSRDAFRTFFTSRSQLVPHELTDVQTNVAERVYDVLRRGLPETLVGLFSQSDFLGAVEYVLSSALGFAVSPIVRLEESVVSHIGFLQDSPSFANPTEAANHVAALQEIRAALPKLASRSQAPCLGAFRILGSCSRSEDQVHSFGELDVSQAMHSTSTRLTPSPQGPSSTGIGTRRASSPLSHGNPLGAGAADASRRRLGIGANITATAMTSSAALGIGIVALAEIAPMHPVVLDVSATAVFPHVSTGSTGSVSRTLTVSSAGSQQSLANLMTSPPKGPESEASAPPGR